GNTAVSGRNEVGDRGDSNPRPSGPQSESRVCVLPAAWAEGPAACGSSKAWATVGDRSCPCSTVVTRTQRGPSIAELAQLDITPFSRPAPWEEQSVPVTAPS